MARLTRIAGRRVRVAHLRAPLEVCLPVAVAGFEAKALARIAGLDGELLLDFGRDAVRDLAVEFCLVGGVHARGDFLLECLVKLAVDECFDGCGARGGRRGVVGYYAVERHHLRDV